MGLGVQHIYYFVLHTDLGTEGISAFKPLLFKLKLNTLKSPNPTVAKFGVHGAIL